MTRSASSNTPNQQPRLTLWHTDCVTPPYNALASRILWEQQGARTMKLRLVSASIAMALLAMIFSTALVNAAPPTSTSGITQTVTGTVGTSPALPATGTLDITRFAVQNGQLVALGTLNLGSIVNAAVAIPVDLLTSTGSCEILNLVLGPLALDVLGLQVNLNQVVLNITAQAGPGNLLGNLLCAVANLLNRGGPLTGLAGLLNNILRLL